MPGLIMTTRWLAALAAAVLLGACGSMPNQPSSVATPDVLDAVPGPATAPAPVTNAQQETLRNWNTRQERLYRVAAPLLTSNTELCKANARNLLGFTAKTRYSYSTEYADAAQKVLGLEERLRVMNVLTGSGAARAGVKRGDILLAAEDQVLPAGANAERLAAGVLGPLVAGKNTIRLNILRGTTPMSLSVPLTKACGFGIELGNADMVAAYADGRRILLTRGMLGFARSDAELAYVLARAMAHTILRHPQKQRSSVAAGNVIDNLIRMNPDQSSLSGSAGIKPMPQAFDVAADKLAVYLLARAGYGLGAAPAFWEKLAAQYPPSVANGYTALHPATPARLAAIGQASEEVRAKQAARKPLFP